MITEFGIMAASGAAFMLIMYTFIYGNKRWCDFWAKRRGLCVDHAIEEDSNLAAALQRAGLYAGLAIGMYGVISGPSAGFVEDVLSILGYGALVSMFFLGARLFNHNVVLRYVDNTTELKRNNVAVGWVECGSYIATGIMAMSSMMGEGGNFLSSIMFFISGQLLLLLIAFLYERTTSWNVREEIAKGNAAAGLLFAGLNVAVAVALHGAIATDFVSWQYNLPFLASEGILAVVFMMILSKFVDLLFLPGTDIKTEVVRDQNVAAITVVVAMKVAGALAISAAVI